MKDFICTLTELALFLNYIHQLFYKRCACAVNIEGTDRTAEGQLVRNNVADGSAVYETNGAGQDIRRSHIFHADHIDMVIDIVEAV